MRQPSVRTWWGQRFMEALAGFTDSGRLQRGRAYSSDSRILEFHVRDGLVQAKVRGNINPYFNVYEEPQYKVSLQLAPLGAKAWADATKKIGTSAGLIARLLMGELPSEIESVFSGARRRLLPQTAKDFKLTQCTCPDYVNPCKHIAGVYYRLAREMDTDPFLLFELRGMQRATLRTALAATPLGLALASLVDEDPAPLVSVTSMFTRPEPATKPPDYRAFWQGTKPLPTDEPPLKHAVVPAILIKKGGDHPAFWNKDASFIEAMEAVYLQVRTKNKKQL